MPVLGLPFTSFASGSTTIKVSSLNLTLRAGAAYGFALDGGGQRTGGSTGGTLSTSPSIGTISAAISPGIFQPIKSSRYPLSHQAAIQPQFQFRNLPRCFFLARASRRWRGGGSSRVRSGSASQSHEGGP